MAPGSFSRALRDHSQPNSAAGPAMKILTAAAVIMTILCIGV